MPAERNATTASLTTTSLFTTAAIFTYTAGSGDLSTPANYAGNVAPGNGQDIAFSNGSGGSVINNNLSSVNSFTFNTGAGAFSLSGNALTIAAGITTNSGSLQTINNNLILSGNQSFNANAGSLSFGGIIDTSTNTLTITGGSNISFSGIVTGNGSLVKEGAGIAFLDGTYNNINSGYIGTTTINQGILRADVGSLVQTSSVQVNNGGTLLLSGNGRHIGAGTSVTLNGGTFNTGGYSEPSGIASGASTNYVGPLTLTATSTIDFGLSNTSVLGFGDVGPHTSGAVLQITNWNGTPFTGGSGDRLLFAGLAINFETKYLFNEVSFNGSPGYAAIHEQPLLRNRPRS